MVFVCLVLACSDGEGQDDGAATGDASSSTGTLESTAGASDTTATTGATGTSNDGDDPPAGDDNGPKCPTDPDLPDELPPGSVGEPYMTEIDHGVPTSTGEVSLVGMLPPGLQTQDAPGRIVIEGTPTAAGRFPLELASFTNDGGTCLPSMLYTLVIDGGATTGDTTAGDTTGDTGDTGDSSGG